MLYRETSDCFKADYLNHQNSQEVFQCAIFPGDEAPERRVVETIDGGSICNLTVFSMCAHNGTHVDAPYHFYNEGKTIDQLDLKRVVGECFVTFCEADGL